MDLQDDVADAGLFGEMTTIFKGDGVKVLRFKTDKLSLYEVKLSPTRQASASIQERKAMYADHLYEEFEEDGWRVSQYVYRPGETKIEEALLTYAA